LFSFRISRLFFRKLRRQSYYYNSVCEVRQLEKEIFLGESNKQEINMTYVIARELDDACHTHTPKY